MKYNKFLEDLELIDSDHKNFSIETPLREDAFDLSDDDKIKIKTKIFLTSDHNKVETRIPNIINTPPKVGVPAFFII